MRNGLVVVFKLHGAVGFYIAQRMAAAGAQLLRVEGLGVDNVNLSLCGMNAE